MSSCVLAVCLYTATMELAELYGYNSHITLSTAFTLSITQASAEGYKTIKRTDVTKCGSLSRVTALV